MKFKNSLSLVLAIAIGALIWFFPEPVGVKPEAWHLFALFVATVIGVIAKPMPMGVISLLALAVSILTGVLTFPDAFSGFSNDIVWLVVFAFFVARGFIATGLCYRLAYKLMSFLGNSSLGLGYALVATDLILAPAIPSVTARVGGIVYPILRALTDLFTGPSHDPKMGGFLTLTAFQGSAITSAMFLTAMAGNPLVAELARGQGVEISWGRWALAASLPGLMSLLVIPYIIYRFAPPVIRQTPHARAMARQKHSEMGPMKRNEWIMLGNFVLLIALWIGGPHFGLKASVATLVGLIILLLSGILKWKDVLEESAAWDTFIWFSTLVTLAGFLNKFGFTAWFSDWIVQFVSGCDWGFCFFFVCLIYFYSHYFFASNVAHIGAMYTPLLIVAIATGTPPTLAALALSFLSSLFGALTHYGSGPAPILFESGYVPIGRWWKIGAVAGFLNIVIWICLGSLWWKILGLW